MSSRRLIDSIGMGMFQVDPVLSMTADFEAFLDIRGRLRSLPDDWFRTARVGLLPRKIDSFL